MPCCSQFVHCTFMAAVTSPRKCFSISENPRRRALTQTGRCSGMRLLSLYFALYCIALHSLYLDFVLDVLQNGVLCQRPFPKYILMGGVMMTLIGGVLSRTACGGMQLYHQTCHAYIYIYVFTGFHRCFVLLH